MPSIATATQQHRLLALLLPSLEVAGIVLSPDRYIRLQRLWMLLPDDCPTEAMRNLLCPVFATDERQQDLFLDIFERIIQQDLELPAAPPARNLPKEPETGENKFEEAEKPERNPPPQRQIPDAPTDIPQSNPKRRPLVVDLDRCTEPPYSWNIAPKDNNAKINLGEGFNKTLLHLRRREWADHTTIDVPYTIKATIAQGGFPAFRYKRQTRPPEYLLLVERFSRNDHRAGLFDCVFQTLRANEVFVDRFFYDSDPRINRNEQYPAGLNLYELRHRYPDARLVLLGSGYRLLSPRTGKLAEWARPLQTWRVRALLTPVPYAEWGYQERQLDTAFLLLPASVESLQYIAESPDGGDVQYESLPDYIREIAETEPIELKEPVMRSLRQHFDSGMLCWIAACAVYPALHFELTLQLGKLLTESLGYNLVTAQNVLALSRLSWFTSGRIPVPVRNDLRKYLEQRHPERHKFVHGYLLKLMEDNPPTNENSVAYAEHRINLAMMKVATGADLDEETVAELRAVVKRLDRDATWGDYVLTGEALAEKFRDFESETIAVPAEIEAQGVEAIQKYIDERSKISTQKTYEAQLIVLGPPRAGKTSLVRKILDKNAPLPEHDAVTRGVDKTDYRFKGNNGEEYRVTITDFGGQERYSATNQLFYRENALYLLVYDGRVRTDLEQYLESIKVHGNNSSVILVHNRADEFSGESYSFGKLQSQFPFLKEEYNVSLRSGIGLDKLIQSIQYHIQALPQFAYDIPKNWMDVRNNLNELKKSNSYITWEDYLNICGEYNITDTATELANYLHRQGHILYISENDILNRIVILSNQWATDAIYKVLNDNNLTIQKGRFDLKDLARILSGQEWAGMLSQLVELLKFYEICYPIAGGKSFIIPQLLPSNPQSYTWDPWDNVQFELHYSFKPSGLFSRFITRRYADIDNDVVWRNGVVLKRNETLAQIIESDNIINIRIKGKDSKYLLDSILNTFDELHADFNNIEVDKFVPCICPICLNSKKSRIYYYEDLLNRIESNRTTIQCSISLQEISIHSLLGYVEPAKVEKKPLKAFISYTKQDIEFVNELKRHLGVLTLIKKLLIHDDKDILPGDDWDSGIKEALESSDIIFLMISPDFLTTDYIWNVEIPEVMRQHEKGKKKVVPVLLRECDWQNSLLGKLQVLPSKSESISTAKNRDEAWNEIVGEIKNIIKGDIQAEITKKLPEIAEESLHEYLKKTKTLVEKGGIDDVEKGIKYFKENSKKYGEEFQEIAVLFETDFIKVRKVKDIAVVRENFIAYLNGQIIEEEKQKNLGDSVEVYVESQEGSQGTLALSRRKAKLLSAWESIVDSHKNGTIILGTVISKTKGGLIVDYDGLEAFLPGSQVDINPVVDYDPYVGKVMELKVIKINEKLKNVVVSHKAVTENDLVKLSKPTLDNLEKGQIFEGIVRNITDFGAFIGSGGVTGLLHLTDISWGRIDHPSEVLKLNQRIKVIVLDFEENKERISLGLKQLTPHPWESLTYDINEGSIVHGKVVNIENYGAFIEIQPGVEGLIHISEISWGNNTIDSKEYFKKNQDIEARVVTIDRNKRKMSLSIKHLTVDPWLEIESRFQLNSRFVGTVKNITYYGIFVESSEGIGGMVHISDLSWTKRYAHPSEFIKVGSSLEAMVLSIDKEKRQISLGYKQFFENPWESFEKIFTVGSYHEGTVIKCDSKGATFKLSYDLEAYSPPKHIKKDDGSALTVGETVMVKVIEFNKDDSRILVSHTRYLQDAQTNAKALLHTEGSKDNSINLHQIIGKTLSEVETILGTVEKIEKAEPSNTPCKGNPCDVGFFSSGEIEIVFIDGKADWITIKNTSHLDFDEKSLSYLGLSVVPPTFSNPKIVLRWENIEGIRQISFFEEMNKIDYIHVKAFTD